MSVSSAQATTVVRNDATSTATETIIAIAIISEATATLVRSGAPPRLPAASPRIGRRPASAVAARASDPTASGAHSEPPKMMNSPLP